MYVRIKKTVVEENEKCSNLKINFEFEQKEELAMFLQALHKWFQKIEEPKAELI